MGTMALLPAPDRSPAFAARQGQGPAPTSVPLGRPFTSVSADNGTCRQWELKGKSTPQVPC